MRLHGIHADMLLDNGGSGRFDLLRVKVELSACPYATALFNVKPATLDRFGVDEGLSAHVIILYQHRLKIVKCCDEFLPAAESVREFGSFSYLALVLLQLTP